MEKYHRKVYNFSAGPATLPTEVLEIARNEMLDWHHSGVSVMEISHRSEAFMALNEQTNHLLRKLMCIPDNYQVLFLSGGARSQFAMIPMNLLAKNTSANYLVTGTWSELAYLQAQNYGQIQLVASGKDKDYDTIPGPDTWTVNPDAKYFYYTPNETLKGLEFPFIPEVSMPLVADMTSCILSRDIDVQKYGVIFAAAQKNLGQAGVTVVIIRDDLITEPLAFTPSMFDYRNHREKHSLYNTSPTYAIYIMNLVLQNLLDKGGVANIEMVNQKKANLLYDYIDTSEFYTNKIEPDYRSKMNVTFNLPSEALDAQFIEFAAQRDLINLKGHRLTAGVRASIYNAMPLSGVEKLLECMQDFAMEHKNR